VIDVLLGNLEASGVGVGSECVELHFGMLIGGADSGVEGDTVHGEASLKNELNIYERMLQVF
jgi:hypothetical protein